MWRVFLPDSISTSLDRWAEAINVTLASPADEVARLSGVPQGFGSNGPVFTTGHSFIAKVKWAAGEPSAALSLGTPLGSESTSTWPTQTSPAYMVFGSQIRAQQHSLRTTIAGLQRPSRRLLRQRLTRFATNCGATTRFEIVIGDTTRFGMARIRSSTLNPGEAAPLSHDLPRLRSAPVRYAMD